MAEVVLIACCPQHGLHGQRDECFVCGGPVEQIAMVPAETTDDPRHAGGNMSGPGGPYEQASVILDTRRSVLLATVDVAMVDNESDGRRFASLLLAGRINRSTEKSKILYLFDADGAAAIVSQLVGLASRAGAPYSADFARLLGERMEQLP